MNKTVTQVVKWLLRAAVSISLIVLLLWHTNLHRVVESFAEIGIGWFLLAVAIKGIGILAGVIRWRLLLHAQKIELRFANLGGAYLVGRFFGSFLPSTIGLDAYRTYYAAVRSRRVAETVAVTMIEKIIGLVALSALAIVVMPFGARLLDTRALWVLGLAISAPFAVAFGLLFGPGLFRRMSDWLGRRGGMVSAGLSRLTGAVAGLGMQRGRLFTAVGLGLIIHGATSAMYLATAQAVGAEVVAGEILFVGPLMILATLVPVSIAGIGVREGVFVFFLTRVGLPTEQAVLLGFLGFLAGEIYSLAGGAIWALSPAVRPDDEHGLLEVAGRAAAWIKRKDQKAAVDLHGE
ncbi:MAG TPA: lysylphosphatidylglycerol synthase transmembrane domain-containing protein [Myxococcota bacterium]|nr:lysylphosphatidylglycerol synthase transmembrane domain-containing protein [Myxococcota bacterium]